MKRILLGLTAVLLTVALAMPAAAAEVQIGGHYGMSFVFSDGLHAKSGNVDRFWVHQSSSVAFNFILDEDIKVNFTIGTPNSRWGGGLNFGGDDSTDRRLRLNYSYVDWKFGKTGLSTRIGMQQFRTPGFAAGTPVFHNKAAGVSLAYKLGIADINFTWLRPADNAGSPKALAAYNDEIDMFYLGVPVRMEGMTILPWAMYTKMNDKAELRTGKDAGTVFGEEMDMWHAGISADLNFGDAFVKADFIYGQAELDKKTAALDEAKGYYAAVKGGYKMGFGTLALTGWYTSGNDDKDLAKGKYGMMPTLLFDGDPAFTATTVGAWGHAPQVTGFMITSTGIGTAGIALALENMSFVEKLFHTPRVAYWMGTSDKASFKNPLTVRAGGGTPIDKKDSAIELAFDSRYVVSKNATVYLDLGYMIADWDKKGPGQSPTKWDKNGYRMGLSLQFRF